MSSFRLKMSLLFITLENLAFCNLQPLGMDEPIISNKLVQDFNHWQHLRNLMFMLRDFVGSELGVTLQHNNRSISQERQQTLYCNCRLSLVIGYGLRSLRFCPSWISHFILWVGSPSRCPWHNPVWCNPRNRPSQDDRGWHLYKKSACSLSSWWNRGTLL